MATSLDHGFTKVICLNKNSRLNRAVFSGLLIGGMESSFVGEDLSFEIFSGTNLLLGKQEMSHVKTIIYGKESDRSLRRRSPLKVWQETGCQFGISKERQAQHLFPCPQRREVGNRVPRGNGDFGPRNNGRRQQDIWYGAVLIPHEENCQVTLRIRCRVEQRVHNGLGECIPTTDAVAVHIVLIVRQENGKSRQVPIVEIRYERGERNIMRIADGRHIGVVPDGVMVIPTESNSTTARIALIVILERQPRKIQLIVDIIHLGGGLVTVIYQSMHRRRETIGHGGVVWLGGIFSGA